MTEKDILALISEDEWMMKVLRAARELNLPDWMIGAGFIRSKVWDYLHGYTSRTPIPDIDLIYFDPKNTDETREKEYDQMLRQKLNEEWSTKNQARMHIYKKDAPYTSTEDALAHWVETPTCIAVRLNTDDSLILFAPHGIKDLVNLVIRPSPLLGDKKAFPKRMEKKNWLATWPKLKVVKNI